MRYPALSGTRFYPPTLLTGGKHAGQHAIGGAGRRSAPTRGCEFAGLPTNRVKRCYCCVTTSEFVVPTREQLRTGDEEGKLS